MSQLPLPTDETDDELPRRSADESTLDEKAFPTTPKADESLMTTSFDNRRNPVDLLADEFASRLRAGETPNIDEFVRRAPEHEAAIREIFPPIAMIEGVGQQEQSKRKAERKLELLGARGHEHLGDFRIVREIGRGGMGVVYEAEQRSLNRRVALKVLGTAGSATERQRQRFQREAESAAKLHHTNIVPVFAIGEADGLAFFAMQFIDGVPLARTIQALQEGISATTGNSNWAFEATQLVNQSPGGNHESAKCTHDLQMSETPVRSGVHTQSNSPLPEAGSRSNRIPSEATHLRNVANIGQQVASALGYAHQHGMLHRDIKPGNLMLDREGNVWITDFGLVKIADKEDLTGAGDLIGTLRYMAPEQFEGRSDERTDIYALGLTLFELLTLRPAFEGDQRTAFAKRVREQEVPRLRTIDRLILRDLETIVAKATAREPSARYQSAAALSEDLQRFLDDRPILARRESLIARFWRWSRRNPALATVTAVALCLLIAVAVVQWDARRRVEFALSDATQARKRAEANVDLAVNAFDSILDNVTARGVARSLALELPASEAGLSRTSLSEADAELLNRLLRFYRQFAEENSKNEQLRERVAQAYHRTGEILVRLGQLSDAEQNFRDALSLLESLQPDRSTQAEVVALATHIHNELGELMLRRGLFEETINEHLAARSIVLKQSEDVRKDPAVRFEFARATDLFASIDVRSGTNEVSFHGRPSSAERLALPAGSDRHENAGNGHIDDRGPPPDQGPEDRRPGNGPRPPNDKRGPPPRHDRGKPPGDDFGPPPFGGPDGPPPDFDDGPPTQDHEQPGGPGQRSDRNWLAMPKQMRSRDQDPAQSLSQVLLEACDEFRSLTKEFPNDAKYPFALAQSLRHRLVHASSTNQPAEAKATFLEAVQILEELVTKSPNDPKYLFELADTLTHASRASDGLEADQHLLRAISTAEKLTTQFPNVSEYQLLHGIALARRAAVQESLKDIAAAEENLARSLERLQPLAQRFPDQALIQIPVAQTRRQLGDLLRTSAVGDQQSSRLQKSRELLTQALADFESYFNNTSPTEFNQQTRTRLYESLAEILDRLSLADEAAAVRQRLDQRRNSFRIQSD